MYFPTRLPALAVVLTCLGGLACAKDQSPTEPLGAAPADPSLLTVSFPNTWTTGIDMPTPRYSIASATVDGVIYLIGGMATPGGGILQHVYAYHPEIGTVAAWRRAAALPFKRAGTNGAVVINGKIYVTGGVDSAGTPTKSLFIYDPATNSWSSGAAMPVPGVAGVSAAINGKLYVLITPLQDTPASFSRLYRFDPATQAWSTRAASQYNHFSGTGGVIAGKFYVVGGGNDGKVRRELEVFDPASNTWTYKGLIPTGRFAAASAVLNGKLYVAGGKRTKGEALPAAVEMYDPGTSLWTTRRSIPTPRWGAGAAVRNGRFYVIGGLGNTGLTGANETYTP